MISSGMIATAAVAGFAIAISCCRLTTQYDRFGHGCRHGVLLMGHGGEGARAPLNAGLLNSEAPPNRHSLRCVPSAVMQLILLR